MQIRIRKKIVKIGKAHGIIIPKKYCDQQKLIHGKEYDIIFEVNNGETQTE